MNEVL
jgi:hypothetical protein